MSTPDQPAAEHPFAQYVRLLGKGPNLARPLTQDEARAAMSMVMQGQAQPVQVGAFLCLLRVKTETAAEAAGLAQAIRDHLAVPALPVTVDVDWSSYAGKSRRLPYCLLAALALARSGVRIFMHGAEHHTAGRLWTSQALAALGMAPATSLDQAVSQLGSVNFAYMTLQHLSPPLQAIMDLRSLLGVRSPIHTVARMVNPLRAGLTINGVTHPPYLPVHQDAACLLGERNAVVFKGDGGEVERRPEKPCDVWFVQNGQPGREEWPALISGGRDRDEPMDLDRLRAIWTRQITDPVADAAICGTMALVLRYLGRAPTMDQAEQMARALWGTL